MKIRILSLTKGQDTVLRTLEEEYRKRLSRTYPVEFLEIKREAASGHSSILKDWKKIRKRINKELIILLDEKGRMFSSKQLADQFGRWRSSNKDLCFVIGGPEGFPEEIKQEADMLFSLSALTLPHKLVRLFLIEALYRANDILLGGPYHKD